MGEGYAAIQRGGTAACSGGWGQSDDLALLPPKGKHYVSKYVMASEPLRYTWYFKQVMASLPYIKIYFFQNTYSIEMKESLTLTKIFLDSQQIFRKVCKKLDFHQNNILLYLFSKSVHGYLTMRCVKYG